jgi:hypothetical protein
MSHSPNREKKSPTNKSMPDKRDACLIQIATTRIIFYIHTFTTRVQGDEMEFIFWDYQHKLKV